MPDFWEDRLRTALGVEAIGSDGPRSVADVDPKDWREAVRFCRDELGCDFFDWLSAVDEGPAEPETEDGPPGPIRCRIVAHLWSVAERRGVLLRALLTEGAIASITDLYPGANWHERETHEMFGVDFPGHPDLKPLLLTPEFEGHPLRKDFVLASRVVKPWPGAKEPGGDRPSKRAPKRPPGVPEDWIQPEEQAEPEPPATETAPETASKPRTASAPETAPDPGTDSDPRTRRPDAP
jgi:NADH-quinone oxidoreductase subunit C